LIFSFAIGMRVVQMNHVWGLFWLKEYRPLKTAPMGTKTSNTLPNVFHYAKNSQGCSKNQCTTAHISAPDLLHLSTFFRGLNAYARILEPRK
jgi:hypothetical protein